MNLKRAGIFFFISFLFYGNLFADELPEVTKFLSERKLIAKDQNQVLAQYALKYLLHTPQRLSRRVTDSIRNGLSLKELTKAEKAKLLQDYRARSNQADYTNSPDFINKQIDFGEVIGQLNNGACFGVMNLVRNMNLLAMYDSTNETHTKIPQRKQAKEYFEFLEKQLAAIAEGKVAVFPNYKNLNELSRDPLGRRAMMERSVYLWAERNATLSGANMLTTPNHQLNVQKLADRYKKIKARIDLNYNPLIFISWKGFGNIHILQATGISEYRSDGSYEIHIWDPNYKYPHNAGVVQVRGDEAYYERDLTDLGAITNDDTEILNVVENLKRFCSKNSSLCEKNQRL